MASYNILISSVDALYSIFKEEKPDFSYNKVSTAVNLREISLIKFLLYIWNTNLFVVILTQGIAGWFLRSIVDEKDVFLNTKMIKNSRKCREFDYTNRISLQGAITLYIRDKTRWMYHHLKEELQTFTLICKMGSCFGCDKFYCSH